jgi:hypothetical protein
MNPLFTAKQPMLKHAFLFIALLLQVTTCVHAQVSDQGINVTTVSEEIRWNATPLQTKTFINGENLNVAEEDWQWINFCSKRKPTVWIKQEEGGKKAYYYNFYAITDPRGLAPEKSFIPTVEQIRNNEIPHFPNATFTKGYLEQDTENEMVPTISTPGDQYYWTKSKHESAAEGEEVAYIFKYSLKTEALNASTGQFCDGYPVILYSQTVGQNYTYSSLLPTEYRSLNQELIDHLVVEPGFSDKVNYVFSSSIKFDSQGFNKSPKFNMNVSNDFANKKGQITSVYLLDESLQNFFKYPKYKGSPLACSDTLTITINSIWTGVETTLKKDSLPYEMLPENFRSNFLTAAQVGKVRQLERTFVMDANGQLSGCKQRILTGYTMKGPMSVILSPLGFGLKTVTKTYSRGYKKAAKNLGVICAIITPIVIPFTLAARKNMNYYNNKLDGLPDNFSQIKKSEFEASRDQWKRLSFIGTSIYTISLTANISGSLILGSKNKKLQKRIYSYMEERYPYGIVIGYDRN